MTNGQAIPVIEGTERAAPPRWAVFQRRLIDLMNRAAVEFTERYTRPDGTLVWRDDWPGMDGSDDAYEGFLSFPLFYVIGGGEHVLELARREWDAITRQFTEYGQIYRGYDAYYDWLHHGESSPYLYYLGMADPTVARERERALRFAAMYTGDDPDAPNWDSESKMIRSPINGSRGPRFEMTSEDWSTHRPILAHYLAPYEDIPGYELDDSLGELDWDDDEVFGAILKTMNERMMPGDIPLNLVATSLVANAFLHAGALELRNWVTDYVRAWQERTEQNNGITPDNIGPSGRIGELMDGKWWGGYYGWRWPHGSTSILEGTLISASNAALLSGDLSHLDLPRSQLDLLWSLRKEEDGEIREPARHGETGWFCYRPTDPSRYVHLHHLSQCEEDRQRISERFSDLETWPRSGTFFKGGGYTCLPWFAYIEGANPGFPDQVLDDTHEGMRARTELAENDEGDPQDWDVHHWQVRNPVVPEGLVQMTMGTPAAVYHGGLIHARVRHFDPTKKRSGLPEDVAALVETMTPDSVTLSLVNSDPVSEKDVVVQAGAFGEHSFTEAALLDSSGAERSVETIDSKCLHVHLAPAAHARLRIGMERLVNQPTYAFPWH